MTSRDGTAIGYRQLGRGPGVIAVHGGMQAAQNLMKLARALADSFTIYLPDRRGRGLSGPPGDRYSLAAECEDIDALAQATGARGIFGLSSGAIIALQAALVLPAIGKAALYEPPLSVNGSTPTGWVARYDREVAQGKLASAAITAARGTQTAPPVLRFVPRTAAELLLNAALRPGGHSATGPGSPAGGSPARRAAQRVLLWPLRTAAQRNQAAGEAADRGDVPCGHSSRPCTTTPGPPHHQGRAGAGLDRVRRCRPGRAAAPHRHQERQEDRRGRLPDHQRPRRQSRRPGRLGPQPLEIENREHYVTYQEDKSLVRAGTRLA